MRKRLFFTILAFSFKMNSQEMSEIYKNQTKIFLDYAIPNFLSESPNLIINETPYQIHVADCKMVYESTKLSNVEQKELKQKLENPLISKWTSDFFPRFKIVEKGKIDDCFKDHENGWKIFKEKFGDSEIQISSPIFLRNYQVVIIKFSITQGYTAGTGFEGIFFKTNTGWSMDACSWDN